MAKLIKKNTSILFALLLFFGSISTFAISQASATALPQNDCHHCGSISACEDGGQSYGYNDCEYDATKAPPDNCQVGGGTCGNVGED